MSCVGGAHLCVVWQRSTATLAPNMWPYPTGKGHRRAAQTRIGVTSHVYGKPPPSTSPFSTARGGEGRQHSYRHQLLLASPGCSLEHPGPATPLPASTAAPRPPCSRRRWGSCFVTLVEGGGGGYQGLFQAPRGATSAAQLTVLHLLGLY